MTSYIKIPQVNLGEAPAVEETEERNKTETEKQQKV